MTRRPWQIPVIACLVIACRRLVFLQRLVSQRLVSQRLGMDIERRCARHAGLDRPQDAYEARRHRPA